MTLDKEEHRTMLLSLIDGAHFPGSVRKQVNELADAIENAKVQSHDQKQLLSRGD